MQQALAEAEFQSLITGMIITGQRKLLRIVQWIINIFISALRAAVKSLLSCKQPKSGAYNEFQNMSFLCSVIFVSYNGSLREDGSMLQEGGVQSDYTAQDAGQQIKIPSILPVPCSELTQTKVKLWNAIAP